jgi:hypothetical protein
MTAYTTAEFDTRERAQDRRYVGMRIKCVSSWCAFVLSVKTRSCAMEV